MNKLFSYVCLALFLLVLTVGMAGQWIGPLVGLNIEFMISVEWRVAAMLAVGICGVLIWIYNDVALEGARRLWGDHILLNAFSPKDRVQSTLLWLQWLTLVLALTVALFGPNISRSPEMVPAGAVQVQFVYDVSPSMGAEEYRAFLPSRDGRAVPGSAFQWGTRIDAAIYYTDDLLPQIANNEAGLITVEGAGYDMWDLTKDLSTSGAFNHMRTRFLKVGAAPGAGADYTSGLQATLDEFELISGLEKKLGDKTDKIRFIVFFTDGGFTGDQAALDKVLDKISEQKVRLLIVGLGGSSPVTVPKYDSQTHRRNGEFYKGTTQLDTKILTHMRDRVKGSQLILAPPGTSHIHYSFPQKAGGLYARPTQSNLRPALLLMAVLLLVSITIGGGGLPRWQLIDPRPQLLRLKSSIVSLSSRTFTFGTDTEDKS